MPRSGLLFLAGVLFWIIASALTAPARAGDFRISFEANEHLRRAIVSEPKRLKHVPRATIIVLHSSENGAGIRRRLALDPLAASYGYATVYPDAQNGIWHNGLDGQPTSKDDINYLRALIRKLVGYGITNPRRVYIVGVSSGGIMALRFACEAGDMLAGSVAVMANLPGTMANCKPAKPLPLLLINGTADPYIPYNGGPVTLNNYTGSLLSTDDTLGLFARNAGCTGPRVAKELNDKDKKDNSQAFLETYPHCNQPVELLRIENGGHAMPGRTRKIGPSEDAGTINRDVETNKVIWDFIRRLPRN